MACHRQEEAHLPNLWGDMEKADIKLKIWRLENPGSPGEMRPYTAQGVTPDMSFLEMLDMLNEQILLRGERPIEFESDCREGICGVCGLVINGKAHGGFQGVTTCMLRMRHFNPQCEIIVEPFRAKAFKPVRDLVVDRSALDRLMQSGGYVSANVGTAPPINTVPVSPDEYERAFHAASCLGCGACVAACPNGSAQLFVAAKITHLEALPQGRAEAAHRVKAMVKEMDNLGFGYCSNYGECQAVCPQGLSLSHIARMRRQYLKALLMLADE